MLQKGKEKRVKNRNSLGLLLSHALRLRNCEYVTRNKFFFIFFRYTDVDRNVKGVCYVNVCKFHTW